MKTIALALLFAVTQALGQSYPSKAVKVMVGVPPGVLTRRIMRVPKVALSTPMK